MDALSSSEIGDAGIDDWRQLAGPIRARFRTANFSAGLSFVVKAGAEAERAGLSPDIGLTENAVSITLGSASVGVSAREVALARGISRIAAQEGVVAETASLQQVEFALDTQSAERVSPFYAALLGAASAGVHAKGDLVDPTGQAMSLWWQEPKANSRFPLPESSVPQRWHLDVWVGHDEAQVRIAAAIGAGGRLVSDTAAPSYWVLEDPDGNRCCICAPIVD